MKKFSIIVLSLLAVLCFALAGCIGNDKTRISTSYFEVSGKYKTELSCSVPSDTENFYFSSKFSVDKDAEYIISYDAEGNNTVSNNSAQLTTGDNVFYITVTHNNKSKVYTVNVYRKALYVVTFAVDGYTVEPQYVEEGKKATEPIASEWGVMFDWNFNFDAEIYSNCSVTGTASVLPKEDVSMEYFSIYVNSDSLLEKQPFVYEVSSEVIKVAYEGVELEESLWRYYEDLGTMEIMPEAFTTVGEDKTIKILTRDKLYVINLIVATFAIERTQDLNMGNTFEISYMQKAGGATTSDARKQESHWDGYFVLGRNLDFTGQRVQFDVWAYNNVGGMDLYGFAGTFNGLGHALSNIILDGYIGGDGHGWYSLFGNLEATGLIKNLRIVNFLAEDDGFEGILSLNGKGKLDNVYIETVLNKCSAGGKPGTNTAGLLCKFSYITEMTNCTFVIRTGTDRDTTYPALFYDFKQDVTPNFNGTIVISDYSIQAKYLDYGGKAYSDSISTNKIVLGQAHTVALSNITKVLKNGLDITNNSGVTITSDGVTLNSGVWDLDSTFVFIGDNQAKAINFTM